MPSKEVWSCSRLSGVPVRVSPPSGKPGIETSIASSQCASRNGEPSARASAQILVFIARHDTRVGVKAWRIGEQEPERVVSASRHRSGTEIPDRTAARRVLHVQDLAVTGEQVVVVEAAPEISHSGPLGSDQDQRAPKCQSDVTEVVA